MPDTRIADIRVTPIAFADPPLLNNAGCHEPFALRSIIEVETEGGVVGLGESYGSAPVLEGLAKLAPRLVGMDVTDLNGLFQRAGQAVAPEASLAGYTPGSNGHTLYASVKSGLIKFSEAINAEASAAGHEDVHCTALCPGLPGQSSTM